MKSRNLVILLSTGLITFAAVAVIILSTVRWKKDYSSSVNSPTPHSVSTLDPSRSRLMPVHPKSLQPVLPSPEVHTANVTNGIASRVAAWKPQTPRDIALSFGTDKLAGWLDTWQRREFGHPESQAPLDLLSLDVALRESSLTPAQLCKLVAATKGYEDGPLSPGDVRYGEVAGAIACQAIASVAEIVSLHPDRRSELMVQVAPLISRLWNGPDRDQRAVIQFYSLLAQFEPPCTAEWFRGRLGMIEANTNQRQYSEAIELARQTRADFPQMSPSQNAKLAFDESEILHRIGDHVRAAEKLKEATSEPGFGQRKVATAIEVQRLLDTGDIAQTRKRYDILVQNGDAESISPVTLISMAAAEDDNQTEDRVIPVSSSAKP